MKFNAGEITVTVGGPHPCWCEFVYRGKVVLHIPHTELRDLEYVLARAMQHARRVLGKDASEV
jgi:hypothetical protein